MHRRSENPLYVFYLEVVNSNEYLQIREFVLSWSPTPVFVMVIFYVAYLAVCLSTSDSFLMQASNRFSLQETLTRDTYWLHCNF